MKISHLCKKQCCCKKHVIFLLTGKERKKRFDLIKGFNTFIYDHTLHREIKHFFRYCLQTLRTEGETLNCNIKDCVKVNDKKMIKMLTKVESKRKFRNNERKVIAPCMIYAYFDII